jgi:hypothetical protein
MKEFTQAKYTILEIRAQNCWYGGVVKRNHIERVCFASPFPCLWPYIFKS